MRFLRWLLSLFTKDNSSKPSLPAGEDTVIVNPKPTKEWDRFFADISHHEPDFNAKTYNSIFLINKCSDGITFVDKTHAKRKKECAENGIKYGGYHFFQCRRDPIAQAEHYVKTHGSFDLLPIIDFEKDKDQNEADLAKEKENLFKCCMRVKELTGKTPVIYSYKSLLDGLKLDPKFAQFPLWLARYSNTMGSVPAPWDSKTILAWQYSDGGETFKHSTYPNSFTGIGNCDSNLYLNDFFKVF